MLGTEAKLFLPSTKQKVRYKMVSLQFIKQLLFEKPNNKKIWQSLSQTVVFILPKLEVYRDRIRLFSVDQCRQFSNDKFACFSFSTTEQRHGYHFNNNAVCLPCNGCSYKFQNTLSLWVVREDSELGAF